MKSMSFLALLMLTGFLVAGCGGGGGGGAGTGGAPDNTPPIVSITSPEANSTVNGTIAFTATASDASGISKVEFYVDNGLISTDTTYPYSFNWDSTAARGAHSIKAIAYDSANNSATSTILSFTSSVSIIVKVKSVAAVPVNNLGGFNNLKITLPAGVSIIDVIATGKAAGSLIDITSTTDQNITLQIISGTPFDLGEFLTMTIGLSPGTIARLSDFTVVSIEPWDLTGNLTGV